MEFTVVFWDIKRETKTIRYIKNLVDIKGTMDMCTIISKQDDGETEDSWKLELCNSIGSPLDMKTINIEPMYNTMSKTHVIIANSDYVYIWQYRNQVARLTTFESSSQTGIRKLGREIAWYIDE